MGKICLLSVASAFLVILGQAHAEDYGRCLNISKGMSAALLNSARVGSAEAQVDQARSELEALRAGRKPQVSAFVRSGVGDGVLQSSQTDNQYGVQFNYRLFDFGRTNLAIKSAKYELNSRKHGVETVKRTIMNEFLQTLVELRHAQDLQKVYSARLSKLGARLESADRQLENNSITLIDYSLLKSEAAVTALNVNDAVGQERRAKLYLQRLLQDETLCVNTDEVDIFLNGKRADDPASLIETVDQDPKVLALMAEIEAANAALQSSQRDWLPTLNASGYTSQAYDDFRGRFNDRDRIGIEVSAPLYDGGIKSSDTSRLRARVRQLEADFDALKLELHTQMATYWQSFEVISDSLASAQAASDSAVVYVSATTRKFELQAGTIDQMLEAEERLLGLNLRVLSLQAQKRQALIELIDTTKLISWSQLPTSFEVRIVD